MVVKRGAEPKIGQQRCRGNGGGVTIRYGTAVQSKQLGHGTLSKSPIQGISGMDIWEEVDSHHICGKW